MRRIRGRLINKTRLTGKIYELTFELINPSEISFSSGQFLCLYLEKDLKRAYSIVNPPIVSDRIIFLVDISPMGPASKYFLKIKKGKEAEFSGPFGNFKLNEEETGNFVFVAIGSGIAPLCSMIDSLRNTEKYLTLYFGLRHIKDIFYFDKFYQLEKDRPNFKFLPTLSQPENGWSGRRGRVTDWLRQDKLPLKDGTFYICGSYALTNETEKILKEREVCQAKIHRESYG